MSPALVGFSNFASNVTKFTSIDFDTFSTQSLDKLFPSLTVKRQIIKFQFQSTNHRATPSRVRVLSYNVATLYNKMCIFNMKINMGKSWLFRAIWRQCCNVKPEKSFQKKELSKETTLIPTRNLGNFPSFKSQKSEKSTYSQETQVFALASYVKELRYFGEKMSD